MITDLPYVIAYREQQQLFLFDWDYISDTIFQTGGASTLAGRFLVQFFYSPSAAVLITLLCLGAIGWLHRRQMPAVIAPILLLFASLADCRLHFDVVPALIFSSAAFSIWQNAGKERRMITGIILTLALFPLAGSAAAIFVLCTLSLPLIALYLLVAFAALQLNLIPAFVFVFSPEFFFDNAQSMPAFHWLFWILMPVSVLFARFSVRFLQRKDALIAEGVLALIAIPAAVVLFNNQGRNGAYNVYKYEYYGVREEWNKLEEITKHRTNYPVTANWHYLAKSHLGTMMDGLMKTRHNGPYDLFFIPEDKSTTSVHPFVLYRMGNMAAAQNVSYNLMSAYCGYNPSMMLMQTKIELMRGNYDVAEKYLSLLAKSFHYRAWAKRYKAFLHNDTLVEAAPELGCGRKDLRITMDFTSPAYPMEALFHIVRGNNEDRAAMEYALAYLLLSKDIINVVRFVTEFYGTPALQSLPLCAQEAVCFFTDYQRNRMNEEEFLYLNQDWCLSHGVEEQTIRRMLQFQEASLRTQGKAPKGFRDTYWYYLMYDNMMMNDKPGTGDDNKAIY